MVKQEKYNQQFASQLIKIEKDIRAGNEALLCIVIEIVEMNRITLKSLQMQSNIFEGKNIAKLEDEIDEEVVKLKERVGRHKNAAKEISNLMSLPSPSGE